MAVPTSVMYIKKVGISVFFNGMAPLSPQLCDQLLLVYGEHAYGPTMVVWPTMVHLTWLCNWL